MPKRTKRAPSLPEWAPTSSLIGTELHLLCVEERPTSGLTFGLTPPPAVYERHPVIQERQNYGRTLIAVDASGVIYQASWRTYGIHGVRSTAYEACHIIPEGTNPLLVRMTLLEAQRAKETFDAHVEQIASLNRQLHAQRCQAGKHVGRVRQIVAELCPLPDTRTHP